MLNSLRTLPNGITLQLNLRLKYLIKRLTFWIQLFTKARDFTSKESLTSAGEALRLLRTNSSAKPFYENIYNFKKRFRARGYPHKKNPLRLNLLNGIWLYKRTTKCERKFYLSLPRTTLLCQTIKNILMSKWYLVQK